MLDIGTLDRHLKFMMESLPVSFQWFRSNQLIGTFSGIVNTPTYSEVLIVGGFDQHVEWHLFFRGNAVLPSGTTPQEGDVFLINGNHYKALRVRLSPDANQLYTVALGWARMDT